MHTPLFIILAFVAAIAGLVAGAALGAVAGVLILALVLGFGVALVIWGASGEPGRSLQRSR